MSGGERVSKTFTTDTITCGLTWRQDGSTRLQVGNIVVNQQGYIAPQVSPNLYIGTSNSNNYASNSITQRMVGFADALSDAEFDAIFAEIAS